MCVEKLKFEFRNFWCGMRLCNFRLCAIFLTLLERTNNGREVSLNRNFGRLPLTGGVQIKNNVSIAYNLAARKGDQVSYSYIQRALKANGYFILLMSDPSTDDSLYD